jgi:mono/diheme cytochrome c family protein
MMMNPFVCWLALAAAPAFGQPTPNPGVSFGLYTRFEHEPSPLVLESLKTELDSLMSPSGLDVRWRYVAAHRNEETFCYLAVVTFRGACDLSGLVARNFDGGILGWTHATDGRVLPFSEVNCDQVRGLLSRALVRLRREYRDQSYGRALARVLAHEIYHVVTETAHHGHSGVAQRLYTVEELMAADFSFAEVDRRVLSALVAVNRPHDSTTKIGAGESLFARSGCIKCHGVQGSGGSHGPSLRGLGRSLDADQIVVRLAGTASKMYRRARAARIHWPRLARTEIEEIVAYLRVSPE